MSLIQPEEFGDTGGDAEVFASMRRLGATSPATACSDRDLPRLSRQRFQDLLDRGILREAAPGTFYLYDHAITASAAIPLSRPTPTRRLTIRLLFWLLVILLPVIVIQFSN